MEIRYCPHCGMNRFGDLRFCPGCGFDYQEIEAGVIRSEARGYVGSFDGSNARVVLQRKDG